MGRTAALLFALVTAAFSFSTGAHAQPSSSCKQCEEQKKACQRNYSAATCKTEYQICLKSCKKK